MNPKEEYDFVLGSGTYVNSSAKLYRNINFRKGIILFMGENTFIGDGCTILVPKLTMQEGSQICAGTVLSGRDEIVLEENVVVGYQCLLLSASDTRLGRFMNDASPESERRIRRGPIRLKKNVFIGSHSTLMPNLTIEEGIVVKAYSYVNYDLDKKNYIYGMHIYKDYLTLRPEGQRF